jgi:mitochondrial fission protein ELM1
MVSEACASDKCVIAIAQNNISPKHKRFIESIKKRLSSMDDLKQNNKPLDALDKVTHEVIRVLSV